MSIQYPKIEMSYSDGGIVVIYSESGISVYIREGYRGVEDYSDILVDSREVQLSSFSFS